MKCPACFELMYNRDEIHRIAPNINRMNLHCQNKDCPARKIEIIYGPYMQVITNDPNPWECVRYGLIFFRGETPILLEGEFGYDYTVAKAPGKEERMTYNPFYLVGYPGPMTPQPTTTQLVNVWKEVKKIPFVKLDTGDDMHMHAHATMEKLTKLMAFM